MRLYTCKNCNTLTNTCIRQLSYEDKLFVNITLCYNIHLVCVADGYAGFVERDARANTDDLDYLGHGNHILCVACFNRLNVVLPKKEPFAAKDKDVMPTLVNNLNRVLSTYFKIEITTLAEIVDRYCKLHSIRKVQGDDLYHAISKEQVDELYYIKKVLAINLAELTTKELVELNERFTTK